MKLDLHERAKHHDKFMLSSLLDFLFYSQMICNIYQLKISSRLNRS